MCKSLEINHMQIYFALLLITLNVPLRIGKCTAGIHVSQVGNPCPRLSLCHIRFWNENQTFCGSEANAWPY